MEEKQLDLNLNIGESHAYGRDFVERELMPYVTSVNVATGAHSGDPAGIAKAVETCKEYENISLGALISYPDLPGYGLRKIQLSNDELRASILHQLGGLAALTKVNNYELSHVRPHGYLYQQIASNYSVAETVAKAMQEFSQWLILVGPASKVLQEVSSWTNIRYAAEARFDLRYKADLSLIHDEREELDLNTISERARNLIYKGVVKLEDGGEANLDYETIHIPTSIKNAVDAAQLVRGMVVKPQALKSIDYEPYLSEFI